MSLDLVRNYRPVWVRGLSAMCLLILAGCAGVEGARTGSLDACLASPDAVCVAEAAGASASRMENGTAKADALLEGAKAAALAGQAGQAAEWTILAEGLALAEVDAAKKAALLAKVAETFAAFDDTASAIEAAGYALQAASVVEDVVKKVDLSGKAAVAAAKAGQIDQALGLTQSFPEVPETAASFKARTFHDIAPVQAQTGDIEGAVDTLALATMGLQYYRASGLTDVATTAHKAGDVGQSSALLTEAMRIGRNLDDAYFVSGVLRHVGESLAATGRRDEARPIFLEAVARISTATAEKGAGPGTLAEAIQARARAISRVATAQAEAGFSADAIASLEDAIALAATEPSEQMRHYANYEIAGSLAFAGAFDQAMSLAATLPDTPFGDAQSLRSAALRDIAWAQASQGQVAEGLAKAVAIPTDRERVAALARIAKSLADPSLKSGPRYL